MNKGHCFYTNCFVYEKIKKKRKVVHVWTISLRFLPGNLEIFLYFCTVSVHLFVSIVFKNSSNKAWVYLKLYTFPLYSLDWLKQGGVVCIFALTARAGVSCHHISWHAAMIYYFNPTFQDVKILPRCHLRSVSSIIHAKLMMCQR